MLNSLQIKNFRLLVDFQVKKLGHVNLIVGKNNSGKSTVLEALRIFSAENTSESLIKIAAERGEPIPSPQNVNDLEDVSSLKVFQSYFSDRDFDFSEGKSKNIEIGSIEPELALSVYLEKITTAIDAFLSANPHFSKEQTDKFFNDNPNLFNQFEQVVNNSLFSISSARAANNIQKTRLDRNGGRQTQGSLGTSFNHAFIPTTLLNPSELANRITSIELTDYKNSVIEALQVFDPRIENYGLTDINSKSVALRLSGSNVRIPLKSMGEGIARVFQIMLSIPAAKDGFLLIDEFENGLHYSVQERVWDLIFKLAKKFNIQVFATTHSWDCIESFAKVANEKPEQGVLFRVAQSARPQDNGKTIAIEYSEDDLLQMTKSNFEVR